MTREEEINEMAEIFNDSLDFSYGFRAGAEWADDNPDLSSLWHDVREEPQIGSNIVAVDEKVQLWDIQPYDGEYDDCCGLTGWRCFVVHYNIQRWAYISDLLPKGEHTKQV